MAWKQADLPSSFNKHLLTTSSVPGPAPGFSGSFNSHNGPRRLLLSSPFPRKGQGDLERGGACLRWVRRMLIPQAHQAPSSPQAVKPVAQVPLLRSPQRDPSNQDIIRTMTESAKKDRHPLGREALRGGREHRQEAQEGIPTQAQAQAGLPANAPSLGHWFRSLAGRVSRGWALVLFIPRHPGLGVTWRLLHTLVGSRGPDSWCHLQIIKGMSCN